jgi:chromosome segregation ATPase
LITIPTDQARPTPANRNPITPDDVALKAASDRHQNAIKGITNLLKIIDQARANKDKAQNDIQAYTQAYNDAVAGQRNAQNDIISIETRTSQIVGAITSLTATVEDLRNRINESAARSDALNR